jgi:hypothetical protein
MAKTNRADSQAARPEPAFRTLLSIKGTDTWMDWLKGLSNHTCLPVANLIDQALRDYAQKSGYPDPMPKRGSR